NKATREAKRNWHPHEQDGPGKYSGEVLDKLKAAREEAAKRSHESTRTDVDVELPKDPSEPATAGGGGSVPPGKGWKKREEAEAGGSLDARDESSARNEEEQGEGVEAAGSGGGMPPGKSWRRRLGGVE
ncbi:hypothetical protein FRC01_007617, partial [Tulasnella sp. 417]